MEVAVAAAMLDRCNQHYVPHNSTARVPEAEAARTVFGVGADGDEDGSAGVVHAADED